MGFVPIFSGGLFTLSVSPVIDIYITGGISCYDFPIEYATLGQQGQPSSETIIESAILSNS
jgi:hypothetical protein